MWKRKTNANGGQSAIDWQTELQQHERWLRTIVYSRLGEKQAVDDVMQEVALAAVRAKSPPTDHEKIAPWLYRVAIRQSLMYRRTCGRQRKLNQRFAEATRPVEQDSSRPQPLEWMLAEERRAMVRSAMNNLPRRDAEILALKYTEDWSYQQIAKNLGISHSAVEARLHRARARLRKSLIEMESGDQTDEQAKHSPGKLNVA